VVDFSPQDDRIQALIVEKISDLTKDEEFAMMIGYEVKMKTPLNASLLRNLFPLINNKEC
jgi:hypothetical protein